MASNFESGFFVGEPAWHGLGTVIETAVTSEEAIKIAGLDWDVVPKPIYDEFQREVLGYKVNMRTSDNKILGIVTDKYKIVQNSEAFAFTDALLGQGVRYETAGSLASGKRVWMLAKMENTTIAEENIDPYLVFTNSHDGTGAIRVAITPIRVVCQNTLNLALNRASRHWSCVHKGDIQNKLEEARYTLSNADKYMKALEEEFGELKLKKVSDKQVDVMVETLLKSEFESLYKKSGLNLIQEEAETIDFVDLKELKKQRKFEEKIAVKRNDILRIYHEKPDLVGTEHTAFRFVNAVSDYATHTTDHKNTRNYQENLFMKTIDGHNLIDTAYKLALAI